MAINAPVKVNILRDYKLLVIFHVLVYSDYTLYHFIFQLDTVSV